MSRVRSNSDAPYASRESEVAKPRTTTRTLQRSRRPLEAGRLVTRRRPRTSSITQHGEEVTACRIVSRESTTSAASQHRRSLQRVSRHAMGIRVSHRDGVVARDTAARFSRTLQCALSLPRPMVAQRLAASTSTKKAEQADNDYQDPIGTTNDVVTFAR